MAGSFLLVVVVVILVLAWFVHPTAIATGATNAGPDLTVEISIDPAEPEANQPVTIHILAKNIGDSDAGAFKVHLYVDPSEQPPNTGTSGAYPIIQVPGLAAGDNTEGTRDHTFTTEGCNHVIYAWIDRDNAVAESNENNNLIKLQVCVGVKCTPDTLENDNDVAHAQWITENAIQAHTLCNPTNIEVADVDTVKFTVLSGLTYTLATSDLGAHAKPDLELGDGCGLLKSSTSGALSWKSTINSVCYATVTQDGALLGPLTAYNLALNSTTGVSDLFEPDNECANARDITTDGAVQSHIFQSSTDEDWVKFSISAGESFIALTKNAAGGVSPIITIFSSCDQVAGNSSVAPSAPQVSHSSTTDQVYFVRIKNQDPTKYGTGAKYDLSVTASACQDDALEHDDNAGQAKAVTIGATAQRHNFCPAGDEDWMKFSAQAGKIYVLETSNLALASDTLLTLYDTNGVTQLAQNDDYGYTSASRVVWQAPKNGTYYARVRHVNAIASGPNTEYDFSIQQGFCAPDTLESSGNDNGPSKAPIIPITGAKQGHNFCADPLNQNLGDQDWLRFNAVAGGKYHILTSDLGDNSDTTLTLYGSDGKTKLESNDDIGQGRLAGLNYTATAAGPIYVRVTQFNSTLNGSGTNYDISVFGQEPPTPTPTPSPSPTPTQTPTPTNTPKPSNVKTLILTNKARVTSIYGASAASQLMTKLQAFANDTSVNGSVVQVESDPAVAAAYAEWTANATSLANNDKANNVIAAIRNRVLAFAGNMPQLAYIVIAGDDRIIPFRRVLDRVAPTGPSAASIEQNYAPDVVDNGPNNGTVKAALAANMILTDDYVADKDPSQWEDKENNKYDLFIPDYAVGRLVENPTDIVAFINNYLGGDKEINTSRVLVTGFDFMQDSASIIKTLYSSDNISTVDGSFIAPFWHGADLRTLYLKAAPPFDVYSVNGHSTHLAQGAPDENVGANPNTGTKATEIVASTTNLKGALVYSAGCHSGLNDPGVLDLPEAFMKKQANYVGNTGFGWGSSGVVYTEALMRNYSRELLRDTKAQIGTALVNAKKRYYSQAMVFRAFDAKILMQAVFYGLPMVSITSGGNLGDDDPFPSAEREFTPPTSFGPVAEGSVGYSLPQSFGSFGENSNSQGVTFDLNDHSVVAAGEPVQPLYFSNAAAPNAGDLRGVLFLGGVYSDVTSFNPVVAAATNEYVADKSEPAFSSDSFYPPLPYTIRSGLNIPGVADTVVMSLGQYQSNPTSQNEAQNEAQSGAQDAAAGNTGVDRIYDQMAFATYYSTSPDRNAANITFVDGILLGPPGTTSGQAEVKVETQDSSGINRVVVTYQQNENGGEWQSQDLTFNNAAQKWSTTITGTDQTEFFVQVVDNVGNVAVNNNKGHNYRLSVPLPLAGEAATSSKLFVPFINKR